METSGTLAEGMYKTQPVANDDGSGKVGKMKGTKKYIQKLKTKRKLVKQRAAKGIGSAAQAAGKLGRLKARTKGSRSLYRAKVAAKAANVAKANTSTQTANTYDGAAAPGTNTTSMTTQR